MRAHTHTDAHIRPVCHIPPAQTDVRISSRTGATIEAERFYNPTPILTLQYEAEVTISGLTLMGSRSSTGSEGSCLRLLDRDNHIIARACAQVRACPPATRRGEDI